MESKGKSNKQAIKWKEKIQAKQNERQEHPEHEQTLWSGSWRTSETRRFCQHFGALIITHNAVELLLLLLILLSANTCASNWMLNHVFELWLHVRILCCERNLNHQVIHRIDTFIAFTKQCSDVRIVRYERHRSTIESLTAVMSHHGRARALWIRLTTGTRRFWSNIDAYKFACIKPCCYLCSVSLLAFRGVVDHAQIPCLLVFSNDFHPQLNASNADLVSDMNVVLNSNNLHAKNIPGGTPPPSNYDRTTTTTATTTTTTSTTAITITATATTTTTITTIASSD